MKKLATILLLIVTLQYTFGLYTVYLVNTAEIKQHMRHAIATGIFHPNAVINLTMPLQSFTEATAGYWQHDELKYGGKMYDIINAEQQDGTMKIKCLCDDDENNLIASFLHVLQKSRQFPGKRINTLNSVFSPFIINDVFYNLYTVTIRKTLFFQRHDIFVNIHFHQVPSPPPWRVV